MNPEKLWTKGFILATLSGFFAAMVLYMTMTTLALYAVVAFDAKASTAGFVASIFVLGAVIGRIFSGKYMEGIGRRRIILSGCTGFFLVSLTYLLPIGIVPLLIIRFLHGATFGIIHTALSTVVVSLIPQDRRGEGIGFFSLNFTLATALGPFIGMYVIHNFSYTMLFWICSLSAFLCLLLASLIKIAKPAFNDEQIAHRKSKFSFENIFELGALPLAVVVIFNSLCYAGVTAFLNSYTDKLHMTYIAPIFFIVYGAFILVIRPITGKLLDKKGDNIVMLPSIACFAASLFVLSWADGQSGFMLAAVLMAFGYGNILNMGQTIAIKSVDPHRIGTATSTYFVFSDIGMGLGPLIMGSIVTWKGFSSMFLVEAGIVTLSILLYYLLHGRHAQRKAGHYAPSI